jgi:uncharacterized coiled-coil protein SlyX
MENQRQRQELNKRLTTIKQQEEAVAKKDLQLSSLATQLQDCKNQNIDLSHKCATDHNELLALSRDLEIKAKEQDITIEELKKHLEISRQKEFKEWLEGVIVHHDGLNYVHSEPADRHQSLYGEFLKLRPDKKTQDKHLRTAVGVNNSLYSDASQLDDLTHRNAQDHEQSGSVAELVHTLLHEWREFIGSSPTGRNKVSATSSLTKAEQRFLQRVSDLVLQANERCVHMEHTLRTVEIEKAQSDLALRVCRDRLLACAEHLDRYRKRAEVAERVCTVDKRGLVVTPTKLISLLRKSNIAERTNGMSVQAQLVTERRDRKLLEIELKAEQLHLRKVNFVVIVAFFIVITNGLMFL